MTRLRTISRHTKWLLLFAMVTACSPQSPSEFTLHRGGSVDLNTVTDKVIFINFWAEWCKPCRKEIPELIAFQQKHKHTAMVLTVNADGAVGDTLTQQAEKLELDLPILLRDPRSFLGLKPSGVLPETIVISSGGRVENVITGEQTVASLEEYLANLSTPAISSANNTSTKQPVTQ